MFTCKSTGKCVLKQWRCDGEWDCNDGSDEFQCNTTETCKTTDFTCRNGRCIASEFRCDGENDCKDNSDEMGCVATTCRPGYVSF